MKLLGAVDASGNLSEEELNDLSRLVGSYIYIVEDMNRDKPLKNGIVLLSLVTAGLLAAKHSGMEEGFKDMLQKAMDGTLIEVMDAGTVGNA